MTVFSKLAPALGFAAIALATVQPSAAQTLTSAEINSCLAEMYRTTSGLIDIDTVRAYADTFPRCKSASPITSRTVGQTQSTGQSGATPIMTQSEYENGKKQLGEIVGVAENCQDNYHRYGTMSTKCVELSQSPLVKATLNECHNSISRLCIEYLNDLQKNPF